MAEEEILDLVNEKGRVIGTASRARCHQNKDLIHQVVHLWIFNSEGKVLWQQRSYNVDNSPGKWDMSCGGHVIAGDSPQKTMKKEIEEELGIKSVNFKLVDTYIQRFPTQTEYIYLYYAIINKPVSYFKIDSKEVQQIAWVDPYDAQTKYIKKEVESTEFIVSQVTRILQKIAFK